MHAFVSVIVPVYNNPAGMQIVLTGLTSQTYPLDRYEVIVADNGSTDETAQVVNGFVEGVPELVSMVTEAEIQGSYAARNKGIGAARGEILAFIDSDCDPDTDWITQGVAALEEQTAAAGGGRIAFTFKRSRPNVYEYLDSARKLNQRSYVEVYGFAATANMFVRREAFDRHGLFRSDLVSGGDYEFGRRITRAGEILIYIENARVRHPARDSFGAIVRKSRRIVMGQKRLRKLGLLEHGKLSVRNLVPIRKWPVDPTWEHTLTPLNKLHLLFLQNYLLAIRWWIDNPVR